MGLNAKTAPGGSGTNITPLEPGTYPARLVAVVDLGLQPQRPFQGKEKKPAYSIHFIYEFSDEFMKDEDGEDIPDKPRWLGETMVLHNIAAEKANSTARYKAFDPSGKYGGDFAKCVNTPVNVTVVLNPNKKNPGRLYENIASVAPMRDKDAKKCPPLKNKELVFNLDAPDIDVFSRLPLFIRDRIMSNLEFKGSQLETLLNNVKPEGNPALPPKAEEAEDEDENPF